MRSIIIVATTKRLPIKVHINKHTFLLLTLFMSACVMCQTPHNIRTYGAKADGKTNNAKAIQATIDIAYKSRKKVVIIPAGSFVTGPINLKSGVRLHLQKGALLLGSIIRMDYGAGEAISLISAEGANNISITGEGTIDGRGKYVVHDLEKELKAGRLHDPQWPAKRPGEGLRPQLLNFKHCKNISVHGITIKNSSGWVQSYVSCENVIIDSIKVESTAYWNNDGLDIVNSKNVSITNSFINSSDDAICLKSEGSVVDSCVNVFVGNCKLRSSASAFKIGTGSKGGFRNIQVDGLEIWDTYRSAIALEAVDGGFLENVIIKNVKARNTGNAFFIRLGHRNKDSIYSTIKNISISNVYVEVPEGKPDKGYPMEGPDLKYPPGIKPGKSLAQSVSPWNHSSIDSAAIPYPHNVFPASITGLINHPVEKIQFENIEIVYAGGANKEVAYFSVDSLSKITEATSAYPEFSMFGELPAWGLYLRHAKDISIKKVSLRFIKDDFRAAIIADDVQALTMEQLSIPSFKELPLMIFNNVKQYSLKELQLPVEETRAIKVQ